MVNLKESCQNISLKACTPSNIAKSRGLKIRSYLLDLAFEYPLWCVNSLCGSTFFECYFKSDKYLDIYLYFKFDLSNMDTCFENISVRLCKNFLYKDEKDIVSLEDIPSVMECFFKHRTLPKYYINKD